MYISAGVGGLLAATGMMLRTHEREDPQVISAPDQEPKDFSELPVGANLLGEKVRLHCAKSRSSPHQQNPKMDIVFQFLREEETKEGSVVLGQRLECKKFRLHPDSLEAKCRHSIASVQKTRDGIRIAVNDLLVFGSGTCDLATPELEDFLRKLSAQTSDDGSYEISVKPVKLGRKTFTEGEEHSSLLRLHMETFDMARTSMR